MNFFLETTDMDLGDTPIENIFINDYLYESVQLLSDTYIGTPGYIYYIKYCLSRIFSWNNTKQISFFIDK